MSFQIVNARDCVENQDQEKKVFVFDLHDVLFARSYYDTLKLLFTIKNKKRLLRIFLSPQFVYDAFKMLSVTRVSEAYLIKLGQKHAQFKEYIDDIIAITNALLPIHEIFALVENLKFKGHKVYIFSNIGQKTYYELAQSYQHLFDQFDGVHYVQDHNDWLAKPNSNAYKLFLEKFNINPGSMVFIDDKPRNILAAQSFGITALLYKSTSQLYRQLTSLHSMSP